MGKRKSSAKAAPKKRAEPLATTFKCLFCNVDKAIVVKLNRESMQADLHCKNCRVGWATTMTSLTQAVDVYSEWIDKCEEERIRYEAKKKRPLAKAPEPVKHGAGGGASFDTRNAHVEKEEAEAAEEDVDGDEDEDGVERRDQDDDDDDDDDDDREDKRRRVTDYDDDEEDE